ncbi:MAG: hypothetical protein H5U40_12095, partial [Polyangiaceae bacterium]|nr:hypothetical protein [Polyangiaceae bacterium]
MPRAVLLLLLGVVAGSLYAAPAQAEPAQRIYVGVYLHDVTRFDQRNGTYDVDLDVWLKWRGDFDPTELRLQNAADELFREDFGATQDGDWHSDRWRIRGT